MDSTIFIGIAVVFLQSILNVGAILVVVKLLHHAFEYEDRWEQRHGYRKGRF